MVYLYWMLMQYVPDFKRFLKNIWPGKIFLSPGKILKRDDLVFLLDGLSELAVRLLRVWGAAHLWRCSTNGCCATERWRVGISGNQGFLDCFFVFIFARIFFGTLPSIDPSFIQTSAFIVVASVSHLITSTSLLLSRISWFSSFSVSVLSLLKYVTTDSSLLAAVSRIDHWKNPLVALQLPARCSISSP